MSRGASRLRKLERSLKAPRATRAKTRALTVMRLEGSSSGTQGKNRTPSLPKDMEDQIAVVRGRAVGKPSKGLLQLEERLLRTHRLEPASPTVQRYEHGIPSPTEPSEQEQVRAASVAGNDFTGRYNIESFGALATSLPRDSFGVSMPGYCGITPPATIRNEQLLPRAVSLAGRRTETPVGAIPRSSEQSHQNIHERASIQTGSADAESFEREIAEMLGEPASSNPPEDNQWNTTMRNAKKNASTVHGAPEAQIPETPVMSKRDSHEVFNQMGLAMKYANSFDLGAMDLSARFDGFDEELKLAPTVAIAVPPRIPVGALTLDEFDLVADLAEIGGGLAAPPAVTAGEQLVTRHEASEGEVHR